MTHANVVYDVIILGSGLGGSALAAVLARQGRRVLVLERAEHPRFAIGESTTPSATIPFKIIGERFDVPEIAALGDFYSATQTFGSTHGLKHAFSFLRHEEGQPQDPDKSNQLPTIAALGSDLHLYRQDVDARMLYAALAHGAEVRQKVGACQVAIDDRMAEVTTASAGSHRAKFLVDATGQHSPLAERLGLRPQPCPYQTQSRSMFTHMLGVRPFDEISHYRSHGFRYPMHQSTLHHLFDGGWFWIIPFDNHAASTNPLCSVGLTLDCRVHPKPHDVSAADEFAAFVARYPSIAQQLHGARAVRDWVSSGRMQYASTRSSGANWALLPQSAGFIDPLFSAGLPQTAAAVFYLGLRLGSGEPIDDGYDAMLRSSFEVADLLVSTSYDALRRSHAVWNAWYRVWVVGSVVGPYLQIVALSRYYRTRDKRELDAARRTETSSLLGFGIPALRDVLDTCAAFVRDTSLDDEEVASRILARLAEVDFLVRAIGFADPARRGLAPYTLWLVAWIALRQRQLLTPVLPVDVGTMSMAGLCSHQAAGLFRRSARNIADAIAPFRSLISA